MLHPGILPHLWLRGEALARWDILPQEYSFMTARDHMTNQKLYPQIRPNANLRHYFRHTKSSKNLLHKTQIKQSSERHIAKQKECETGPRISPIIIHPPHSRRPPHIKTRHRHPRRIARTPHQPRPRRVRARHVLEQRALRIDGPIAPAPDFRRALRVLVEAHVEPLVGQHVPAQHEGHHERVVVLAVQHVFEEDVLVAVAVVAAA